MSDTLDHVVIVAVDDSAPSEYAITFYLEHVHKPTNHVILLHCVEPLYEIGEMPSSEGYEQKAKETMSVAQKYEEKMRLFLKDRQVKGDVLSVCGHRPGETVIQTARQHGAELIVTGCRNQGGLRSVSQYVTHNANCAVMVCREHTNGRNKANRLSGHCSSTAFETP